jgi:ubiquinone/menaquinone biosynthesis C-methylase UbiE
MLNVIDRAALTKEHKKAFSDLLNLSRNNTSNDVYLEVQSLDQALILLFNKNIPLTILYDMDRKYYKEVSIREEFNSWESNVSSFLGNKAINYYDAENLLVDDTVFLRELRMYKFHPGEVIADLGAGSGYFERVLSKYSNNLTVYATDIDSAIVTRLTTELAYLEMNDKTNITYISVLGNEKASGLPFKSIDKVIVRNTFHHFSYPNDMLKDCKRIMKENGTLFIVDILVDEATKVPKCNLHLSRKVFLNYLTSNGFVLVNETKLGYDNFKCFEFQIMP